MIGSFIVGRPQPTTVKNHIFATVTPVLSSLSGLDETRFDSFTRDFPLLVDQTAPLSEEIISSMRKDITAFMKSENKTSALQYKLPEMMNSIWILCQKEQILTHQERIKAVQDFLTSMDKAHPHLCIGFDMSNLSIGTSLNKTDTWISVVAEHSHVFDLYARAHVH